MPRPLSEAVADSIPRSQLVDVPGAGHVCNLDEPGTFTDALETFLRVNL
jgi:pimeloyl-ACP methyl ester carboxylesterase